MGPSAPLSKAEILREIQFMMKELFELDSDRVQPDARLIEDLELDSIDAIDLAVKVEETTGLAFEETTIRQLRTVEDVIVAIEAIVNTHGMPTLRASAASASQVDPSKQTDP
jgi:acyl carrier protein